MNRLCILGTDIDVVDMRAAVEKVKEFLYERNSCRSIFTANPHSLIISQKDNLFCKALKSADLMIPDGILLVMASKIFYPGSSFQERVAGPDLFLEICRLANERGYGCFFYGATEDVLKRIKDKMNEEFPNIRIVGCYSPPFRELTESENEQVVKIINDAHPDILWVGLSAPKQEKWVFMNKDRLRVKIIGAVGAAFDFYAGTKKRSSSWFRKHGLEWLPRLLREPKRMWRRNFVSAPLFLYLTAKEKLRKSLTR